MKGLKTGGRRKGSLNKITSTVKDNVILVFDEIGGAEGMKEWAMENRTEFYRLYARLLPADVNMTATITHVDVGASAEFSAQLRKAVTQSPDHTVN